MSSSVLQALLDLEAARRRDVLEVDPAERRRDQLDRAHDLIGVRRVEADREGVDVGELLEQAALALHHRHRRERPDVAEPEHGGAVGDDRDRVALDRVLEGACPRRRRSPGRRARRRACRPSRGRRASSAGACCAARSCRRRAAGTCGRSCRSARRRRAPRSRRRSAPSGPCPAASTTMSRRLWLPSTSTRSTAPTIAPASAIAPVSAPSVPCASSILTRMVSRYCALGVALTTKLRSLGCWAAGHVRPKACSAA